MGSSTHRYQSSVEIRDGHHFRRNGRFGSRIADECVVAHVLWLVIDPDELQTLPLLVAKAEIGDGQLLVGQLHHAISQLGQH